MPDLSPDLWWCQTCDAANRDIFVYLENGYWKCHCPQQVVNDSNPATKPPIPAAWSNNPIRG